MLQVLAVAARLAQFLGAAALFGAPLFFLYGLPGRGPATAAALPWPRRLLGAASAVLLVGALVGLSAQTAGMTGEPSDALRPAAIWSVLSGTDFGPWIGARVVLAALGVVLAIVARPSRGLWIALAVAGAGALSSLAFTGHGASDDGTAGLLHLAADVLHLLAAGVWLGALAVLAMLLAGPDRRQDPSALEALHGGLAGFSGVGAAVVATLIATGLVNGWFLIGPDGVARLLASAYGLLLLAKLGLFAAMIGLAALNRFVLTPGLGRGLGSGSPAQALAALRRSVGLETAAAVAVLALVAVLGTLEPLRS